MISQYTTDDQFLVLRKEMGEGEGTEKYRINFSGERGVLFGEGHSTLDGGGVRAEGHYTRVLHCLGHHGWISGQLLQPLEG
jgi:hypothetical protein